MILCDIGNTSYHFLLNGKDKKFLLNEELEYFNDTVYYISVNKEAEKRLKLYCKKLINLENLLDFKTSYKGLGIDRKFACLNVNNALVIDAGSAITVDIMENYKHIGGFILPGLKYIKEIYPKISPVLDCEINLKLNLDKIPLNTQDAISYAVIKSIITPIKELSKDKKVIITGGDAKILEMFLSNSICNEHLIFDNMKGLINDNNCITKR